MIKSTAASPVITSWGTVLGITIEFCSSLQALTNDTCQMLFRHAYTSLGSILVSCEDEQLMLNKICTHHHHNCLLYLISIQYFFLNPQDVQKLAKKKQYKIENSLRVTGVNGNKFMMITSSRTNLPASVFKKAIFCTHRQ